MASFMPGEYDMQVRGADRKRKFAEALRQQQQPQGQMIGGVYVAPAITQHLASLLGQYQGNKMLGEADQMERSAFENQRNTYKSAADRLAESLRGKPEMVGNNTDDASFQTMPGVYQAAQQPSMEDMLRAQIQYAQDVGDPNAVNQAVSGAINYQGKRQDRADDIAFRNQGREDEQQFRAQQAQLQREAQAQALKEQIAAREQAGQESASLRRELAQMQMQNSRDMAQFAVNNRQPQAPVSVMGQDGKPVFVAPGQAYGRQPYSAKQEAQDAVKTQQSEQSRLSAQQVLDQAQLLYGHKGRKMGTGSSSWTGSVPLIASDAKDFQKNLDTFKAQTFVPMVSALKGMGALSDAEGRKLSESVGALDPNMSEEAFASSLKKVAKDLYDKAKASGLNVSLPEFAAETPVGATGGWSIKRKP